MQKNAERRQNVQDRKNIDGARGADTEERVPKRPIRTAQTGAPRGRADTQRARNAAPNKSVGGSASSAPNKSVGGTERTAPNKNKGSAERTPPRRQEREEARRYRVPVRSPKSVGMISALTSRIKGIFSSMEKRRREASYKSGALAHASRRVRTEGSRAPIVITLCVLASVAFALVLGNILGDKADISQGTTTAPSSSPSVMLPDVDKVPPTLALNAYFADMSGADPENSLSDQTSSARESGNALFFELRYQNGDLLYTSDVSEELGYPSRSNLTLQRLKNHLAYYNDYAVGIFSSDYLPSLSSADRLAVKSKEISLLEEAADTALSQLIIRFSGEPGRDDIAAYQSYLIDLKLACPSTPIGIRLSLSYISNADNSGTIAQLLSVTDFFVLDLGGLSADEIDTALSPLVYYIERYEGAVMIASSDATTLGERIAAIEKKKIDSYIVR